MAGLLEFLESTAGSITVLVAGLTALGVALRWLWRRARRLWRWAHEFVADVRSVHELIRYQLSPNGGRSIVDQVSKIEPLTRRVEANHQDAQKRWKSLDDGVDEIKKRLDKVEAAVPRCSLR